MNNTSSTVVEIQIATDLWLDQIKEELRLACNPDHDEIVAYCHMAFGNRATISVIEADRVFSRALRIFPARNWMFP